MFYKISVFLSDQVLSSYWGFFEAQHDDYPQAVNTFLNQLDILSIAPELFSCLTSSTTKGCIGFLTIEFFEISKSLFLFYEFSSLLFSIKVARLLAC